jgi:hypothetical protein
MTIVITLLFQCLALYYPFQDVSLQQKIEQKNREMEEAFNRGDMEEVASFYLDDAVMLAPNMEPLDGKAIANYWKQIENPVSWELEVIAVTPNEQEIYQNEFYKALERKPPSWRKIGVRPDVDEQALVYQLGRSTLVTERDGKPQKSMVNFILVWMYTPEGYRILVDTYS